jgi:hypothetical protein
MADALLADSALDLVWSLWTELGVPGPRRSHTRAVLDPERLLTVTPRFAASDARLLDLVFSWCVQHGERLSGSRLTALVRAASPEVRASAEAFLAELGSAGVGLLRISPIQPPRPRDLRDIELTAGRAALLRLRIRALVGVGGRADVLTAMLAAPGTWVSASALVAEVGLAKRHIARILSEMTDGGITLARKRGNVHEVRLANPAALAELVSVPAGLTFPNWDAVFEWTRLASELTSLSPDRPATMRVEVAKRERALLALAADLGMARPPQAEATAAVIAWAAEHARAMAAGTSPCVGGAASPAQPVAAA